MGVSTLCYAKLNRPIDLPMMQETLKTIKEVAQGLVRDYREKNAGTFIPIPDAIVGGFNTGTDDLTYFTLDFRLGKEERRNLSIHFGCHNDSDYLFGGENIILSFSPWSSSDLIMKSFSEALVALDFVDGVWYVPSDAKPDEFIKFEKE